MPLLELSNLKKSYASPTGEVQTVLDIPHFSLDPEEQVAIEGTSGSGKTTFLNIISGILRADSGQVLLDGVNLVDLSESRRDLLRAWNFGYVFQTFNLLEGYTALENVLLGMMFGSGVDREYAVHLLEQLGVGHRMDHSPSQLSIGQQQRVAVARALANRPHLVLADEPTGNLDPGHSEEALQLMRRLCEESGASLLLVSHDPRVISQFDRVITFTELNCAEGGVA